MFGPARASADIMDSYVFEPGSLITFGSDTEGNIPAGVTELVSGSFTYDATTNTPTAITISLAGPAPYSGTYTLDTNATGGVATAQLTALLGPYEELDLAFADFLGNSPDALTSALYSYESPTTFNNQARQEAIAGGVEFAPAASAVPEPSSVILLVTLVAIVGFLTRRKLAGGWGPKRTTHSTA
jgi:hypothetical protein